VVAFREQQFEQKLARFDYLCRFSVYNYTFADLKGTRWLQRTLPFYFHQAHSARRHWCERGVITQGWDVNPGGFGCLKDGLTGLGNDLFTVYGDVNGRHRWESPFEFSQKGQDSS